MDYLDTQLSEGLEGLLKFLSMHGIERSDVDGSFVFEENGEKYILNPENSNLFFDSAIEQLKFLIRLLSQKK